MKIKIIIFCLLLLVFSLYPYFYYATAGYQELNSSLGKIILDLGREEALDRFGPPAYAAADIWYYSGTQDFFVYFSPASLLSIYLYPQFCETTTGVPLELKVFAQFPDLKLKDITSEVQFLFSEPQNFVWENTGVFIPTKAGKYQIFTKYKGVFSNLSYVAVKEFREKPEKEQLLNIDVLPFKPKIPPGSKLNFVAFGTFFDPSKNKYFIRDLSHEAKWFVQNDTVINVNNREIYFPQSGKFKVFCKYQDMESFSQDVEVQNNLTGFKQTLRHIAVLPEFIVTNLKTNIDLKAFGTYDNNAVEDITSLVNWGVSDNEKITKLGEGHFLSKSEGVTEVIADLADSESLPAKIIITNRKGLESFALSFIKAKQSKTDPMELLRDIKGNLEALRDSFIEQKKLMIIRIIPDFLKIPLGSTGGVNAYGVYTDNSQLDLTLLGEWVSSDNKLVRVSQGRIETLSPGETQIHLKFKELISQPALVLVEEPRLVSLIIYPQKSQISTKEKLSLKCEGVFSDSSRKDITTSVDWKIADSHIIKIENGVVSPLRIGQTQLRAGYLGIESLPAEIKVVRTKDWLTSLIVKIISFFISAIIIIFLFLYFLTEEEKNRLKSLLDKNPGEFIVNLYDNVKTILSIFGLSYQESIQPLHYAKLVQDRYSIKDNLFLRLTTKFEETKYSGHILQPNDAASVQNDYHDFLRILFSHHNKFSLFFKYCLTLIYRKPLFISSGKLS